MAGWASDISTLISETGKTGLSIASGITMLDIERQKMKNASAADKARMEQEAAQKQSEMQNAVQQQQSQLDTLWANLQQPKKGVLGIPPAGLIGIGVVILGGLFFMFRGKKK